MSIDLPENGELNPNHFYVLEVEDLEYSLKDVVERCLAPYGLKGPHIRWSRAKNNEEALYVLDQMAKCSPKGRGFDAIFCDIFIPPRSDCEPNVKSGFEVAQAARDKGWLTAIIGVTAFGQVDTVNQEKEEYDRVFDEFLEKDDLQVRGSVGEVKLRRWLIPTAHFAERARGWDDHPAFFGRSMWGHLRTLLQIASQDVGDWHLPKILLLGEPGCGKGMLAWTYYTLLREVDRIARGPDCTELPDLRPCKGPVVVNCASLTAEGEGGKVRLFGYRGPKHSTLHSAPGVFEQASVYPSHRKRPLGSFAPDNETPDYAAGGVVFLDEFIEMKEELQASVLNTLEEGVVYRQDGSRVEIGCHLVFATNAGVEKLTTGKVRQDLLDRIPYILSVPPLYTRVDEIEELLMFLTACRLRKVKETRHEAVPVTFNVRITTSAKRMLERTVKLGLIKSLRQLQTIADVLDGETVISDANLRWLFKKAGLLNISPETLVSDRKEITASEKARILDLPLALQIDTLPENTRSGIGFLHRLFLGDRKDPNKAFPITRDGKESKRRFWFLLSFVQPEKAEEWTGKKADARRQALFRAAAGTGITDTEDEDQKVSYLLSDKYAEA